MRMAEIEKRMFQHGLKAVSYDEFHKIVRDNYFTPKRGFNEYQRYVEGIGYETYAMRFNGGEDHDIIYAVKK